MPVPGSPAVVPDAISGTPVVSFQIAFSSTFVPELSPRETKLALPAAPAAAISWNACAEL